MHVAGDAPEPSITQHDLRERSTSPTRTKIDDVRISVEDVAVPNLRPHFFRRIKDERETGHTRRRRVFAFGKGGGQDAQDWQATPVDGKTEKKREAMEAVAGLGRRE